MSLVEDQRDAANAKYKEESRLAELDHRIEMAKISLAQTMPKDQLLRVEEFKYRRTWNAKQTRWWKPCEQVLVSKPRQFKQK
jgi:hypothetical protein